MIVIVTTGGGCVGELLKVNNSLEELDMGHNPFGDDGMSSVADGLQCNNTLTKLNVQECGLSVKGTVIYKKFGYCIAGNFQVIKFQGFDLLSM